MDRTFLERVLNRPDKRDIAYYKLNDLYLDIQAGRIILNRYQYNLLNEYLNTMLPPNENDSMRDWWIKEFQRLPGWLDV